MSRQEISDFERGRIIGMQEAGKSEREIAEKTAHPKTTVHDIIVKYRDLDQENHIQKIKKNQLMYWKKNGVKSKLKFQRIQLKTYQEELKQSQKPKDTQLNTNVLNALYCTFMC